LEKARKEIEIEYSLVKAESSKQTNKPDINSVNTCKITTLLVQQNNK